MGGSFGLGKFLCHVAVFVRFEAFMKGKLLSKRSRVSPSSLAYVFEEKGVPEEHSALAPREQAPVSVFVRKN